MVLQKSLPMFESINSIIAYPMPSYFFVSRHNHETAQRLQLGMERAIHDGSFGKHLNHFYGKVMKVLDLEKRKVLVLSNPYLTEESWTIGRHTLRDLQRRIQILSSPVSPASDLEP